MEIGNSGDSPSWARAMWHAWEEDEPGWKEVYENVPDGDIIWIARVITNHDASRIEALTPGRWMVIERFDDGSLLGMIWPCEPGQKSSKRPSFGRKNNDSETDDALPF